MPRHTYSNIIETGGFTLNKVREGIADKAHFTSAKFDREEYLNGYFAPFVMESKVKLAVSYVNSDETYHPDIFTPKIPGKCYLRLPY